MDFLTYLKNGVTPHFVVANSVEMLKKEGFTELALDRPFDIKKGGKYFVNVFSTALYAFSIGENAEETAPFRIAGAHTDHPCLHIKPVGEFPQCAKNGKWMKLNTEVYGGPILNTWLDRPLSIAGIVTIKGNDPYRPVTKYIDFKRPVATIPNVAIHFNRDVNKGTELGKQTDMLPILGVFNDAVNKDDYLLNALSGELGIEKNEILDCDLYVYNTDEPAVIGLNNDMISSPRLDNLTSCYALLCGISEGTRNDGINIACLFDHEEIGSGTKTGANSATLELVISKILIGLGFTGLSLPDAILSGFLFSVDVAHATHPIHPEKYDEVNNMGINEGITIKVSSNQRYTFDTVAVGIAMELCKKAEIGFKKFVNRSDVPGGGTIGPMISSRLPMHTVDIGVPILAMHSSRELCGAKDEDALIRLMTVFFS